MKKYILMFAGLIMAFTLGFDLVQAQQYQQPGGINYGQSTSVKGRNVIDWQFFGNNIAQGAGIVKMLPAVLLGIAVVIFFFFLIRYLIASENDVAKKKKNLQALMYSLVAIFIMVALWGIIAFMGDTLGLNTNVQVTAPEVPSLPRNY